MVLAHWNASEWNLTIHVVILLTVAKIASGMILCTSPSVPYVTTKMIEHAIGNHLIMLSQLLQSREAQFTSVFSTISHFRNNFHHKHHLKPLTTTIVYRTTNVRNILYYSLPYLHWFYWSYYWFCIQWSVHLKGALFKGNPLERTQILGSKYSGLSLKGHSLERTPLYKGHEFMANTMNVCNAPSHQRTPL